MTTRWIRSTRRSWPAITNTLSGACHSPDYRTVMFSYDGMSCLLECDRVFASECRSQCPMLVVVTTRCNACRDGSAHSVQPRSNYERARSAAGREHSHFKRRYPCDQYQESAARSQLTVCLAPGVRANDHRPLLTLPPVHSNIIAANSAQEAVGQSEPSTTNEKPKRPTSRRSGSWRARRLSSRKATSRRRTSWSTRRLSSLPENRKAPRDDAERRGDTTTVKPET